MLEVVGLVVLGLVAGVIAAALGLGGGIVFVPVLVVVFGFDQHVAQGTSVAVIFPTAIMATLAHTRMGNVRWKLAIPIGLTGIVGAVAGAQVALQLDADLLRRLFGLFLIVLAVRMLRHAWRINDRSEPTPGPS